MKRTLKKLLAVALCALIGLSGGAFVACGGDGNEIKVCASEIPHAEILNGKVKDLLAEKGYKLTVTVLDWTIQNDSVANGDYDANYFQHIPYLSLYKGRTSLSATCKVHYEPLGIYYGKAAKGTAVTDGTSFIICADESNGVRALELLKANGVFSETSEGDNYPITSDNRFNFQGETWTSASGVTVTLIPEENLAGALSDYDFACLPCNTALTGNRLNRVYFWVADKVLKMPLHSINPTLCIKIVFNPSWDKWIFHGCVHIVGHVIVDHSLLKYGACFFGECHVDYMFYLI